MRLQANEHAWPEINAHFVSTRTAFNNLLKISVSYVCHNLATFDPRLAALRMYAVNIITINFKRCDARVRAQ